MKIIYTLSTAQRKDLLIRGTPVVLAIPAPPIEIEDAADWARSMLPSEFRPMVTAAEESEVLVEPKARGSGAPSNLTELLGAIISESGDPPRGAWLVTHVVVLVTLTPPRARHSAAAARWPANVTIDARPLLGGTNPSEES